MENIEFFVEESKSVGEIFLEEKVAKSVRKKNKKKRSLFSSLDLADCEEKEEAAFVCGCVGVCAISSLQSNIISIGVCVSECT